MALLLKKCCTLFSMALLLKKCCTLFSMALLLKKCCTSKYTPELKGFPVSTRRRFGVDATLLTSKQRYHNVKTTSCAYWVRYFPTDKKFQFSICVFFPERSI